MFWVNSFFILSNACTIMLIYLNSWLIFCMIFQILSKADNNTVMEAVDPEVSITCTDLAHVKKTFQLALLCTKKNPSERPTMHEVARVLVSLLPSPLSKILAPPAKKFDYAHFVIEKGQQRKMEEQKPQQDNNSSNAQWFVRFGDVISKSTWPFLPMCLKDSCQWKN